MDKRHPGLAFVHLLSIAEARGCQRAKRAERRKGAVVTTKLRDVTCPFCREMGHAESKLRGTA